MRAITAIGWPRIGARKTFLLVALADKVWKGKRVDDLELRVVDRLGDGHGRGEAAAGERWERFMMLDDVLSQLAEGADVRLAYQATTLSEGDEVRTGDSGVRDRRMAPSDVYVAQPVRHRHATWSLMTTWVVFRSVLSRG